MTLPRRPPPLSEPDSVPDCQLSSRPVPTHAPPAGPITVVLAADPEPTISVQNPVPAVDGAGPTANPVCPGPGWISAADIMAALAAVVSPSGSSSATGRGPDISDRPPPSWMADAAVEQVQGPRPDRSAAREVTDDNGNRWLVLPSGLRIPADPPTSAYLPPPPPPPAGGPPGLGPDRWWRPPARWRVIAKIYERYPDVASQALLSRLWSVGEAAVWLEVSPSTIRSWRRRHRDDLPRYGHGPGHKAWYRGLDLLVCQARRAGTTSCDF